MNPDTTMLQQRRRSGNLSKSLTSSSFTNNHNKSSGGRPTLKSQRMANSLTSGTKSGHAFAIPSNNNSRRRRPSEGLMSQSFIKNAAAASTSSMSSNRSLSNSITSQPIMTPSKSLSNSITTTSQPYKRSSKRSLSSSHSVSSIPQQERPYLQERASSRTLVKAFEEEDEKPTKSSNMAAVSLFLQAIGESYSNTINVETLGRLEEVAMEWLTIVKENNESENKSFLEASLNPKCAKLEVQGIEILACQTNRLRLEKQPSMVVTERHDFFASVSRAVDRLKQTRPRFRRGPPPKQTTNCVWDFRKDQQAVNKRE